MSAAPPCGEPAIGDVRASARAAAIEEAGRATPSDTVAVLLMPAQGAERRFQIGFGRGGNELLSIAGARSLKRQIEQLLNIHDGKPPR